MEAAEHVLREFGTESGLEIPLSESLGNTRFGKSGSGRMFLMLSRQPSTSPDEVSNDPSDPPVYQFR